MLKIGYIMFLHQQFRILKIAQPVLVELEEYLA